MRDYTITKHGIALPADNSGIDYVLKSKYEGDFPNQIYMERGSFFLKLDPDGKIAKLRKKIQWDNEKGFYTDKYDKIEKLEKNDPDGALPHRKYVRKLVDAWMQGEGLRLGKNWRYRENARKFLTKQVSDMISMVAEDLSDYIDPDVGVSECPAEGFNYFRNGDGFAFRTTFDLEPEHIRMLNRVYSGQFDYNENEFDCSNTFFGNSEDDRRESFKIYGHLGDSVSENLNSIIYSILTGKNLNMVAATPFNVNGSVSTLKPDYRTIVGQGVFTSESKFLKTHEQDETLSSLSSLRNDLISSEKNFLELAYDMIPRNSSVSHDERIGMIDQSLRRIPIRPESKEFLKHILPVK